MSTDAHSYLAVLKASYDYAPQSDDEIAIREDQLLLLVERTDDDWWKVRPKADSPDAEEQPAGLVPSAYVDQAEPTATVKAQYAYDAAAPGELTVAEDDLLHTFGPEEDGWLLVQARGKDGAGYVPANYVEESTEEAEEAAPAAAAAPILANIVVPDSPPRPARPVSTYADPADLVASSTKARAAAPAASDAIQTWAVSEVDKKGKKKKGTLGVGNGAVFFASESDKTPVQKWQTADVNSSKIDKAKHILIEIGGSGAGGGSAPASLHFHAGSKDAAEAIAAKLDASRALASAASASASAVTESGSGAADGVGASASASAGAGAGKKGASVHFSEQGPAIIPPREDGDEEDGADEGEGEGEDTSDPGAAHAHTHAGEAAVALYDFAAQGDDEMSVAEGEALWIVERDGDEWWKCRNARGEEGVVPASYVEPSGSGAPAPAPLVAAAAEDEEEEEEDTAAQEAEARASAERAQKERKKIEQEQRAKAAAAAAEVDRKRKERDAREAEQKAKERAEADARKRETPSPSPSPSPRPSSSSSSSKPRASTDQPSRSSTDKRGPPPSEKTRVWHDRSGQFRVEAAFLGFANGKIRLHKVNGVVIEVPSEKMSVEDMRFVERATGRAQPQRRASDDDDEPLAHRRSSLKAPPRSATAPPSAAAQAQAPKKPTIDWFEFFLNAGCDVDDCTRYASAFERDKMDAQILPDITESTMRSLGLREGDIIRVRKAIAARAPPPAAGAGDAEQLRRDEELARQLQAEESKRPVAPPPNLFAAGPGGALKSTRRGRPPPSKSGTLASVELGAIATASDQIQRSSTPQTSSAAASAAPEPAPATATASVQPPALPAPSGFDDDAWTPRPSSTKPAATPTPTPPVLEPRAPSAPPAPPAPAPAAQRVASPPAPAAAVQPQPTSGGSLAKTTESDIFDQLARLSQLRVRSPPAVAATLSLNASASASLNASAAPSPAIVSPPPGGYAQGMGMGSSPVPLGQHLHAQQTGLLPPPRAPSVGGGASGPRGPYAPVPANQTLLQPLIPTTTGFGGFVPTRGSQASPFQPQQQPQQPLQQQFQQQFQQPQQPSFLSTQPTGFNAQPMLPQQTGFQMSGPLMSQPTGFGGYGGGGGAPPPVPPLPSFQSSNSFGQMQPSPTGFNPGFGQPPSFNGGGMHSGLPGAAPQQQQGKDTSPANIFAQMKAGTFANDAAPQSSDKYDALRPAPAQLTAQPTGWGYPGFPGGYGGYQ